MRKIFVMFALALFAVGCGGDEPTPDTPVKEAELELLSESSLWFEAEGGMGEISYSLENESKGVELTATSSVEWIAEFAIGESITYVVAENPTEEERRGVITVAYGSKEFTVSVMQRANLDVDVNFSAKSLDGSIYFGKVEGSDAYSYNLVISANGMNQSGNLLDNASYYLFDLYAAQPEVDGVATIPAGEYTLGIEKRAGIINDGYSKLVETTSEGTKTTRYSEVRFVVSEAMIEAYITLENGEVHYLRYEGDLSINFYEEEKEGFSTLRRDYYFDINDGLFVGAYLGNYYDANADTCSVYLFEHLDLETGEEAGDEFQLDLQLPRGGTDICGTYTPGTSAGHFLIGYMEDMGGGQYMQTNTWYMTAGYADFAPLVDGTIKVEKDENDVYTFSIDCIDDKGHKIAGKFRGTGKFTEW